MRLAASESFPVEGATRKAPRGGTAHAERRQLEMQFSTEVDRIVAETGLSYGEAIMRLRDTRPQLYAKTTIARVGGVPGARPRRRSHALVAATELERAAEALMREAGLTFRKALCVLRLVNPDLYERGMRGMKAPTTVTE